NSGDFFYLDNDGPDTFGIQLNTVLTNVTVWGHSRDDFWTQDVMFFTPSQDLVQFIDNVWNFSATNQSEPASTFFSGNGTATGSYYYDEDPALFTVGFPLTVHLYMNATTRNVSTVSGPMEVSTLTFGFDLVGAGGFQVGSGIYDTVEFDSNEAPSAAFPLPHFQVNGGSLTPTNFLLYDSELMIGGPGGGSTTQIYALNGSMSLSYLNGATGRYAFDPTAWDAGTDTGETAQGISEWYNTAGTVDLGAGPSFVLPLWNATPSGNQGTLTATGTFSPDNGFVFVSPGASLNNTSAAWAPILPGGTYRFTLPAGIYSGIALASNHDSRSLTWLGGAGTVDTVDIALALDLNVGVDTPLFAWNNDQLANLSFSGAGTEANPYLLYDDQSYPFLPYFGEMNDFLFPVFPGVLIVGTSAYWELSAPPSFTVVLPPALAEELGAGGLPDTNQLQIEVYDASHGTIIGGSDIGGWFYDSQFSFPEPYYPDGEIVLWGDSSILIADNTFQDQGVGIVLMQGSGNTIFGNEFLAATAPEIAYPAEFGIYEFESGDLIYNNVFDTLIGAYSPPINLYNGLPQINLDAWNLSSWETASTVNEVNGFALAGSILGSPVVCGNWWWDYVPGEALPYGDAIEGSSAFIETGGDYCPFGPDGAVGYHATFSETGLLTGTWTITVAGVTATAAAGDSIVVALPNGTWSYSVTAVEGYLASPASGTIHIDGASTGATIGFSTSGGVFVADYPATIEEVGLPAGTEWTVDFESTAYSTNASAISFSVPNGTYSIGAQDVADYTVHLGSSFLTIQGSGLTAFVLYSPDPGFINATVSPSTASVSINGTAVPLAFGGFSVEMKPGTYAIEVTASGYATYFNNVTVAPSHGVSLAIALASVGVGTAPGNSTTTTAAAGLSTGQFEGLVVGLVVLAAAILVAALLVRRRGGGATPDYYAPAPTPTGAPPAAAPASAPVPEYSEENLPPSGSG
ncbi:MAG TPA: thermopsin family protease, partial [Thermoplasmata archaeon]|nr:thermopsin family protease [Thermoplasmata archaeon]